MKKFCKILWLVATMAVATAGHAAAVSELRVHGSNTIGAELMPELAESWLKNKGYSNVTRQKTGEDEMQVVGVNSAGDKLVVEIKAHGSTTAFTDLNSGSTDIGMASRPIKSSEVRSLSKLGKLDDANSEYVLALDGVAVIVNSANPINKLDKTTLEKIFTGEVKDWAQVGGKAGPIHVYARDERSGTFDTFSNLVLEGKGSLAAGAKRYESNEKLSDDVAADPSAIGFTGLAYVRKSKVLSIADGGVAIPPTAFSVATEDYALARRLFLYVPTSGGNNLAKEFADFTVSDKGQKLIDKVGFVSQEIRAESTTFAKDLPEEYLALTKGAMRLSLNIRFDKGSTTLDNKAQRDEGRLVAYMQRGENANKKLMLFGFSDANEAIPMVSLALSTDRADAVADLFVRSGLRPARVRGYGSVAPVASNDSEAGRNKNRRVEVWVK